MIRIATLDSLAARPFALVPPAFPADVMPCAPAEVYSRAATGMCDAALLPAARLGEFDHLMEPLGAYGIASADAAFAATLVCQEPVEAVITGGKPIGCTQRSQTVRDLLRHLARGAYGYEPVFTHETARAADRLLIGDDAALYQLCNRATGRCHDLGRWWRRAMGYPFVWARWAVRRDLGADSRRLLLDWLDETTACAATEAGRERLAEAGVASLTDVEARAFARSYYTAVHVRLSLADLHGLSTFLRLQEMQEPWNKSA
ncbi:MAG: MqnA/MqnD/SBP family protein [Candidatus Hydrogenedentota bacterium]